ncbi:MAG TPA: alpha/beta hydrolase domain-containing protein, partial [Steroidobacteraceae bacterium]|nr:alpha/beta hydrolase domain-containing protein [Steroidobacteraceae bacterium]
MRTVHRVLLLAITSLALAPAHGRVLDVEVTSRRDVMGGQLFGTTGAYEALRGRVHFAVAVANPHNARIVDLAQAANLKNGEVEFWADFFVLRPKDRARGNGALLLEVPNRGDVGITRIVDGGDALHEQDAGDGWLMRHGYAFASIGWQWDATGQGALKLQAPIARPASGRITGLLRGDVMLPRATEDLPLGHLMRGNIGGSEYPVAEPDDPRNTLSVRDSRDAPRTIIPRSQWEFEHDVGNKLLPSDRFIHLTGGFKPGKIYEYVYVVADPVIAGLGFAAVRDFASYAKHAPEGIVSVKRVYGEGISQNGRFLRNFLYDGFNADEEGRMALDGVLAHVAGAGRGSFNYRFAQPSRDAQPTSSVGFPTDLFPFTDEPETDPVTGVKAGLLDRASAEHVEPKIFFSNTSYEYWSRAASLIHTSPDATRDVEIGANVRIYHYTGLQHFTGAFPPAKGTGDLAGQQPESPLPIRYFWRSMIENLDAWVRAGT